MYKIGCTRVLIFQGKREGCSWDMEAIHNCSPRRMSARVQEHFLLHRTSCFCTKDMSRVLVTVTGKNV